MKQKLKDGKAPGLDNIPVETWCSWRTVHRRNNEDPELDIRSWRDPFTHLQVGFITVPKPPGTADCEKQLV